MMVELWLPYGNTEVCLTIPTENLVAVLNPNARPKPEKLEDIIIKALDEPVNSPKLRQIAKRENKISILLDEKLNLEELKIVISKLVEELKHVKIDWKNVTFILGSYADSPSNEKKETIRTIIPADIQMEIHNPRQEDYLVELGSTSYKTHVFVNKIFAHADVKIIVGKVGLHPYAGYSGGSQTLLQACGIRTIQHNYNFSVDPNSRVGILTGNLVHRDMAEAATLCKINFALNMIVGENGAIWNAYSGNFEDSFSESVKFLESIYGVTIEDKADVAIVSAGGSVYDYAFYVAQESLEIAARTVKDGGTIILVAECAQGHGNSEYLRWIVEVEDFKEFIRKDFFYGMHKNAQLREISEKFKVIIVSTLPETIATGIFKFKTAKRVNGAMETAFRFTSKKAKTIVIPYAMKILPIIKTI